MGKRHAQFLLLPLPLLLPFLLLVRSSSARFVDYRPKSLLERGPSVPPSGNVPVLDCSDELMCPVGWVCDGGVENDKYCRKIIRQPGQVCEYPWLKCSEDFTCKWLPSSPEKICVPKNVQKKWWIYNLPKEVEPQKLKMKLKWIKVDCRNNNKKRL